MAYCTPWWKKRVCTVGEGVGGEGINRFIPTPPPRRPRGGMTQFRHFWSAVLFAARLELVGAIHVSSGSKKKQAAAVEATATAATAACARALPPLRRVRNSCSRSRMHARPSFGGTKGGDVDPGKGKKEEGGGGGGVRGGDSVIRLPRKTTTAVRSAVILYSTTTTVY